MAPLRFDLWFCWPLVVALFLWIAPSAAASSEPGLSELLAEIGQVSDAFQLPALDPPALAACREKAAGSACLEALYASYAAMPALRGNPFRTGIGQRLSHALAEEIVERQSSVLPPGAVPVRFRPMGEGRLVHLEPKTALVAGQRYEIRLEGLPAVAIQTRADRPSPVIAAVIESLQTQLQDRFPGEMASSATELASTLEAQAAGSAGLPVLAGVRVLLAAPLSAEKLRGVRVAFVPASEGTGSPSFVVADAVAPLREARRGLEELPCAPVRLRSDRAAPDRSRYRGRYPAPGADGAVEWLPFQVALPTPLPDHPDLVVLVDGLGGSMDRLLADQSPALLSRGLGVVAVELPRHGERAEATAYLAPENPAGLAKLLPRGALDIMAAIRQIRCGLLMAPGRRLAPAEIHFLGYSLGGMTGVLVRSAEPTLARMALIAPSADLADWLSLSAARARGVPLVSCAGGDDHGASCLGIGRCAGSGVCLIDPSLDAVGRHIRWPWQVAAMGADPADYAARPAGSGELLILSGGKDGILAPRQTYRLAEALGMQREGEHRWKGPAAALREWPDLGHGLVGHPEVRQVAHDFLAGAS